ncbi:hypothetical protein [Pelosinus sp. sgz500959]|uniref:hypothetical protein n=1 Tax=Pelosinus sp. sgz500959 TaxID=3242472 RepID=UPI00366EC25A
MASIVDKKVVLSETDMMTLNAFIGFGDFARTDVLVFGIEEGLGGHAADDILKKQLGEIKLRIDYFGKDASLYFDGQNKHNGYWASGLDSDMLREECYRDLNITHSEPRATPYVYFTQKILLSLAEDCDQEAMRWFSKDPNNRKRKDEYANKGKSVAYTDWRPLPRQKEGIWFFPGSEEDYINSFDFKPSIDYYEKLRDERLKIYKSVLNSYPFSIIIGLKKDIMKKVFEHIFKDKQPIFFKSKLPSNMTIYWAKVESCGGQSLIVCMDHLSSFGMSDPKVGSVVLKIRQLLRGQNEDYDIMGNQQVIPSLKVKEDQAKLNNNEHKVKEKTLGSSRRKDVADFIVSMLKDDKEMDLEERKGERLINFIPKKLEFVPRMAKGWTKSNRIVLFEFQNSKDNNCEVKLCLYYGPGSQTIREKIYNMANGNDLFNITQKSSAEWICIFKKTIVEKSKYQELDSSEINELIRKEYIKFKNEKLGMIIQEFEKIDWDN